MPEGPEVRLVSEYLNTKLTGTAIYSIVCYDTFKVRNLDPKMNLVGRIITTVTVKGKSILILLDDGSFLESKLNMEGKWERFPSKHCRCVVTISRTLTPNNSAPSISLQLLDEYCFNDTRHFGSLSYHITADDLNKRVGPDLLAYALTYGTDGKGIMAYYTSRIRNPRIKDKDITYFLMEQKYLSGIGNYLKAEVLYHCRLYPGTKLKQLNDIDIAKLLYYSLSLILQAYSSNGLTIRTYVPPNGHPGSFDPLVYSRTHDPNLYPVIKQEFDDKRTTHYCPMIQTPKS